MIPHTITRIYRSLHSRITLLLAVLAVVAGAIPTEVWSQCNCAAASLVGDVVNTKLMNFPNSTNSTVVSPQVELPAAGPILMNQPNQAPRWDIDFDANTIRIDFIGGVATYTGGGATFTFSSLDPTLPGCPAAHIVGVTATTNKAAATSVVAGATFTAHSVVVPFTGATTLNWNPGEWILVRLTYGCDTPTPTPTDSINPCCPPWGVLQMKKAFVYQGTGAIGDPYRLVFQPSAAMTNGLKFYVGLMNSQNPSINSLSIQFQLLDAGPIVTAPSSSPTPIGPTFTRTWTTTTGPLPTGPPFFLPALQVNHWYTLRYTITLNNGLTYFPEHCARGEISVIVRVIP
jgi:hypothetical protein